MSILVLILAIVATVVCFEAIRRGAFGPYAWAGYLIIFVIWVLILLSVTGTGTRLNLGRL
jgi:hypothetical protein